MGVQISEILVKKELRIEDLSGKVIAIDAFNHLYQFLSTIRQRDGTPLMDSNGNVTSHLSGLFSRTTNLMEKGIKLAYVFDGKAPELKKKEQERRAQAKIQAEEKYKIAVEKEDISEMKKYASRTSKLTPQMIDEAKELLLALGVPVIQAPSEGEAQAAFLVKQGDAYAVSSQDSDSLIFGSPLLVRNLSISGRRKKGNKLVYEQINPEIFSLSDNLKHLNLNQDQLLALAMLVGTDYNYGGIKGIGPKNALKLIAKHDNNFDELFEEVKWSLHFGISWQDLRDTFLNMPVNKDYNLSWGAVDENKVKEILVLGHNFSEERVNSTLDKIKAIKQTGRQKGLGDFF